MLSGTEPPAGDVGIRPGVSACRSVWTFPITGEVDAPSERMIHARTLRLHAPGRLHRLGGAKSGLDARFWDGGPCGYEGLLTDQFGILATVIRRYALC
jgi:hypothetical protein